MRRMPLDAPWWGWALVTGSLFGVVEVVSGLVEGNGAIRSVIGGVIAGLIFGAVMGPFMARRTRHQRAEFTSYDDLRAASRAALRGPIPEDPSLRAEAIRYASYAVEQNTRKRRRFALVTVAGFVVLSVVLAVSEGEWWFLLAGAFFLTLGVVGILTTRRLQHRLTLMQAAPPVPSGSS